MIGANRTVNEVFYAGDGDDRVFASDGNDTVYGQGGDDFLTGGSGDDKIFGGSGDDFMRGDGGADILDGGSGRDMIDYLDSPEGVQVNLATGAVSGGSATGDVISNIEDVLGSHHDDVLIGDGGSNELIGAFGDDILKGGGGDDILKGGRGNDTLYGGKGADTFVFDNGGWGNPGWENDTIRDFNISEDTLDFTDLGLKSISQLDFNQTRAGLEISYGDSSVMLSGVNLDAQFGHDTTAVEDFIIF